MVLGSKNHHKHVLYTMSKRGFKLGSETRRVRNSKDTPIIRKNLEPGVLGEANMDGSVFIDKSVKPGSKQEKEVIAHEGKHAQEIASGKIAYGDDFIRDGNKTYHRKTIDGVDSVKVDGKWKQVGDPSLKWEQRANKAQDKVKDGRPKSAAYQKKK